MIAEHPDTAIRKRAAIISVVVGVGMIFGKWAAFLLTGSQAILSDALESIVHLAATVFALVAVILSARPPDPKYPYGYGKISYFSAGFEGGLIALASLAIFYEAAQGLIRPHELDRLGVGFSLILLAFLVNLILGAWLVRVGKRSQSLILVADGQHVLVDSYTSLGVIVGVALVWMTGLRWLDPFVAILVGVNILKTGYELVRESIEGLMDRADDGLLKSIIAALQENRREGWIDVHHLRAWRAGDRTFVDFHLVVPEDWTVVRLHEAHDRARAVLRSVLGDASEVIIHFDPDHPARDLRERDVPWSLAEAVRVPDDGDEDSATGSTSGGD